MSNPKFSKAGQSDIELDGYVNYPLRRPREKVQVTDRTAGGTLQVEDLGVGIRRFPLDLVLLDQTTRDALVSWWDIISDGAYNTFTYTDEDGTEYTVRLLTNPMDLPEDPPGRFTGSLLLEVA